MISRRLVAKILMQQEIYSRTASEAVERRAEPVLIAAVEAFSAQMDAAALRAAEGRIAARSGVRPDGGDGRVGRGQGDRRHRAGGGPAGGGLAGAAGGSGGAGGGGGAEGRRCSAGAACA